MGYELIFWIAEEHTNFVIEILKTLEENVASYDIKNISICDGSIADVIVDRGSEYPSNGDYHKFIDIMNAKSSYDEEFDNLYFFNEPKLDTGFDLWKSQFKAILWKRLSFWSAGIIITKILLIILYVLTTYALIFFENSREPLRIYQCRMEKYSATHTILDVRNNLNENSTTNYHIIYGKIIFWKGIGHKVTKIKKTRFEDFFLWEIPYKFDGSPKDHIMAATYAKDIVLAWFSNYRLHTVPISLNHVHKSFLM